MTVKCIITKSKFASYGKAVMDFCSYFVHRDSCVLEKCDKRELEMSKRKIWRGLIGGTRRMIPHYLPNGNDIGDLKSTCILIHRDCGSISCYKFNSKGDIVGFNDEYYLHWEDLKLPLWMQESISEMDYLGEIVRDYKERHWND